VLQPGLKVTLTANAYPGDEFAGTVALINPFLSAMQRTAKARVDIQNTGLKLRPGMYMNLELEIDSGEALSIPISAVMPTGRRSLVFVDKGSGKLEPRYVQLGGTFGEIYEVKSGLQDGERVVSSANFLIDAESKVQGAVKSFEEPAPGEVMKPPSAPMATGAPLPKEASALYEPAIADYLAVEKLLAQDKLDGLDKEVASLRAHIGAIAKSDVKPMERVADYQAHVSAIVAALEQFKGSSLEEARVGFGKVSAVLITTLNEFPPSLKSTVYVMNCPMWEKSPADWMQVSDAVVNPFMGKKMSGCGDVVKTIAAQK
jgi:Cu(I)/Ag(I) efflux system membrane fusion protein